jgi:hypothetical protein
MNLRTLFFASLLLVTANSYGQDRTNELSVSCGVNSYMQIYDRNTFRKNAAQFGLGTTKVSGNTGSIFLTYRHFFTRGFALGLAAGMQSYDIQMPSVEEYFHIVRLYAAIEARVLYFSKKNMQLYGLAGVSFGSYHADHHYAGTPHLGYAYNPNFLGYQLAPLGMSYYCYENRIAIFGEAGYGYKGVANLGVAYRFGAPKLTSKHETKKNAGTHKR